MIHLAAVYYPIHLPSVAILFGISGLFSLERKGRARFD
jgi:hypothetical protein